MIILATMSLPAVDRPNAARWNAARSCQFCEISWKKVGDHPRKMGDHPVEIGHPNGIESCQKSIGAI